MQRWMQLWWRKRRQNQRDKFLRSHVLNVRAWAPYSGITDLRDPNGKRLLFDKPEKMAQHTF